MKTAKRKDIKEIASVLFVILFIMIVFSWGFKRGRELGSIDFFEKITQLF